LQDTKRESRRESVRAGSQTAIFVEYLISYLLPLILSIVRARLALPLTVAALRLNPIALRKGVSPAGMLGRLRSVADLDLAVATAVARLRHVLPRAA
jgi:hypothetical protein